MEREREVQEIDGLDQSSTWIFCPPPQNDHPSLVVQGPLSKILVLHPPAISRLFWDDQARGKTGAPARERERERERWREGRREERKEKVESGTGRVQVRCTDEEIREPEICRRKGVDGVDDDDDDDDANVGRSRSNINADRIKRHEDRGSVE